MPHEDKEKEEEQRARSAYDLIRMRLDRLEKNIDKPVSIPQRRDARKPRAPPDFVRNVVGSSAAAGSAEFHIFRNNRKREMDRLDYMNQKALQEQLDAEYLAKRDMQMKIEEEKTAKKRAKRQRYKEKMKRLKKNKAVNKSSDGSGEDEESSDNDGNSNEGSSRSREIKSEEPSENGTVSSSDDRNQSHVTKAISEVKSCDDIENVKANEGKEVEPVHCSCTAQQDCTCTVQQYPQNTNKSSDVK